MRVACAARLFNLRMFLPELPTTGNNQRPSDPCADAVRAVRDLAVLLNPDLAQRMGAAASDLLAPLVRPCSP